MNMGRYEYKEAYMRRRRDGEGRGYVPPPLQISWKFFSGKCHEKFGNFVNFSCTYFRERMDLPPKLTLLLRLRSCKCTWVRSRLPVVRTYVVRACLSHLTRKLREIRKLAYAKWRWPGRIEWWRYVTSRDPMTSTVMSTAGVARGRAHELIIAAMQAMLGSGNHKKA